MKFLALLTIAGSAFPAVIAFCCSGPQCADGTGGTPCCATQSCNIFCCACGGHCRGTGGKRELLSNAHAAERDVDEVVNAFAQADTAGNGNLTMGAYLDYMNAGAENTQMWVDWFNKHDKNGDGVITIDETS